MQLNSLVTTTQKAYSDATDERVLLVKEDKEKSVLARLDDIAASVLLIYGRKSSAYQDVTDFIADMRSKTPITVPATETTPEYDISQSQLSYGSLLKTLRDIVDILKGLTTPAPYNSLNPYATIPALETVIVDWEAANTNVANKITPFLTARHDRAAAYEDLSARSKRIDIILRALFINNTALHQVLDGLQIWRKG